MKDKHLRSECGRLIQALMVEHDAIRPNENRDINDVVALQIVLREAILGIRKIEKGE